jgi:hypothetical protein
MKSRKLCAVVAGSLVVLAMSLPVMAQETTQSTTTTQTPDQPQTKTTQSDKTRLGSADANDDHNHGSPAVTTVSRNYPTSFSATKRWSGSAGDPTKSNCSKYPSGRSALHAQLRNYRSIAFICSTASSMPWTVASVSCRPRVGAPVAPGTDAVRGRHSSGCIPA